MDQLGTTSGFHRVYKRQLLAIANAPEPPLNQLLLVLTNAVMFEDQELIDIIRRQANAQDLINLHGDGDQYILSFILSVDEPFELIHRRTTPGGWRVMYNELRALRPVRDTQLAIRLNRKDYDATRFNFNLVPNETFWESNFHHRQVKLFYNKFPIERYHSLIVPTPELCQPQFLEAEDHALAWDVQAMMSLHQPRLVIGYNAHGAGESINHLHFQLIPDPGPLKILERHAIETYPIPIAQFDSAEKSWRHIHRLQAENRTFNLVYAPGRVFVVEREYHSRQQVPAWTSSFAWWELAGGILVMKPEAFDAITDDQITAVFHDISPQ